MKTTKLIIASTIVLISSTIINITHAGILNYHRNFGLACVEANYTPAYLVRENSILLSDAIRDTAVAILDLTRAEEHWSLSTLQGHRDEAEKYKYNLITSSNQARASIYEAQDRLKLMTTSQLKIINDAKNNALPGKGMDVYNAAGKFALQSSNMQPSSFNDVINKQLNDYASILDKVKTSIEKTNDLLMTSYFSQEGILTQKHTEVSNQIRETTKDMIALLSFAEQISEQTVNEVRNSLSSINISSCANEAETQLAK